MSNDTFLLMLFLYSAPVVSGVLSIFFLYLAGNRAKEHTEVKLRKLLTFYFLTVTINWIFALLLLFAPTIVACLNGLVYSLLLLVQVFLYHYLYLLTADTGEKPFSFWHYGLPIFVFVGLSVWSLQVPPEVRFTSIVRPANGNDSVLYHIITATGNHHFNWYKTVVASKPFVRALYSFTYTILAIRCILRYRKKIVNFSADAENTYLGWSLLVIILNFPLFLTPVITSFMNLYEAMVTFRGAFPAAIMFIQLPVLCYYTITHRYVLMTQVDHPAYTAPPMITVAKIGKELEEFMDASKPYLKADLKITDLAGPLKTNRSYLSSFINNTYGINFSQFINGYRLRELDALKMDGKYTQLSNLELIHKAGFGSYHAYYRAKKQQDKQKLLKPDE